MGYSIETRSDRPHWAYAKKRDANDKVIAEREFFVANPKPEYRYGNAGYALAYAWCKAK